MPEPIEQLEQTPEVTTVMPAVRPFVPALQRQNDQTLTDAFISLVSKRDWPCVYELMWPVMTDDERDILSKDVLEAAQIAVDKMNLGEKLLKQIAIKIVFYLLKAI
jgi:hypothetical protein